MLFDTLAELERLGNKRKAKIELLKSAPDQEALQQVFRLAYDWRTTFGMRVRFAQEEAGAPQQRAKPIFGGTAKQDPWASFLSLLADLAARRLTGNAAKQAWSEVEAQMTGVERQWASRVLNRDLKVGLDRSSIAEIWPDLIEPFGVQLAKELDPESSVIGNPTKKEPWLSWPVIVEPKLDGMRVVLDYDPGTQFVQAFSREGHSLPHLAGLCALLAQHLASIKAPACRIDSEAYAADWNSTLSLVKKEDVTEEDRATLTFYCFDCILTVPADARPLVERREVLKKFLKNAPKNFAGLVPFEASTMDQLVEQYNKQLDAGHEGVMVKFLGAPYTPKRTNAWLKLKPVNSVDAEILDFEAGKQGSKNEKRLGAFVVRRLDTDVTCRVGGGMSDAQRDAFWADRENLAGKILEFKEQGERGSVAAVSFPRFVRIRHDRE